MTTSSPAPKKSEPAPADPFNEEGAVDPTALGPGNRPREIRKDGGSGPAGNEPDGDVAGGDVSGG